MSKLLRNVIMRTVPYAGTIVAVVTAVGAGKRW